MKTLIIFILIFLALDVVLIKNTVELKKQIKTKTITLEDKLTRYIYTASFNGRKHLVSKAESHLMAKAFIKASIQNNIDLKILVAIVHQESNFIKTKVSSSGDVSIAQINLKVWKPFLESKGYDMDELKNNPSVAISAMCDILNSIKKGSDKKWYGKYHSKTKLYKNKYLKVVDMKIQGLVAVL